MGIDFQNHVRIIDYDMFELFNDTDREKKDANSLSDFGYEFLMFCAKYEYFFESNNSEKPDDPKIRAGNMIFNDDLYRKHLFDKFSINVKPKNIGIFLNSLNVAVSAAYSNLPIVMQGELRQSLKELF